jgi:gas vesicle protein
MVNRRGNFMGFGRHEDSTAGTAFTFLLIGIGAGALAALLFAPKSGEELRRDIRRKYKDAKDAVEDFADEAKDRVGDALERGADWVEGVEESARKKVAPLGRALRRD